MLNTEERQTMQEALDTLVSVQSAMWFAREIERCT